MKNRIKFKKNIYLTVGLMIIMLFGCTLLNIYEYKKYTINYNNVINNLVSLIHEKYPSVDDNEIMDLINNKNTDDTFFKKYGIDINNESIVKVNETTFYNFLFLNLFLFLIALLIFFASFIMYNRKREKEIDEILTYIEKINDHEYNLDIDANSEDELSILKNEIYKTTIMLKESLSKENIEKMNLKQSLEDISHQIKTPLTSILIMLDNLIEDEKMDSNIRKEFISNIKREIVNINFLVKALLKLSRLNSNVVKFSPSKVSIGTIIDESIKNIDSICDLKNIKINVSGSKKSIINCDYRWQVEALSNILKNSIEHSYDNNKIDIIASSTNAYLQLEVRDYGSGITDEDKHDIFGRFYKSNEYNFDSIGIGLSISKKIIEYDHGSIMVNRNEDGTSFIIRYYHI